MKVSQSAILSLFFGGMIVCSQLATAQDATNSTPARPGKGQFAGKPVGPFMAILQQLDLTPEQNEKVRPLMRETGKKIRELDQEGALTPEEKMGQMKEIMEGTGAKLKTILTPEQYTKFQELFKELREKRAKAMGKTKMPGYEQPSNLPTNSAPVPGLGQNTN